MTRDEFFTAVCSKFGWQPTPWRLAVFNHWATQEGMPFEETWNPLATTRLSDATPLNLGFEAGYGPGNWNSVPVRVYASPESGIEATFETLALGYYDNIRRCFTDQAGYPEAVPEFTTYVGNVSYGQRVVDFMNSTTASKLTEAEMQEIEDLKADLKKLRDAVFAGGNDRIDALAAAGVVPLESRVYDFESNDGPIGKRLAALESHTGCPRGDV